MLLLNKIIFMGTPDFAVPALTALCKSKFKPILVVTQPDKPKGRNKKLQPSSVKKVALEFEIKIIQPSDINEESVLDYLESLQPDLIITIAYGGILKRKIRHIPRLGCVNLHPSLSPLLRGPAPLNYTLFNGFTETGNTIFKIRASIDSGKILYQTKTKINPTENVSQLNKRLSESGAKDLLVFLELLQTDKIIPIKQNHDLATFTSKIEKKDTFIDWNSSAEKLQNKIRGLSETPGAVSSFRDKRIKILQIKILASSSDRIAGEILEIRKKEGIVISTATNNILIEKLQPAGKKIMKSYDFHLGARITISELFQNGF